MSAVCVLTPLVVSAWPTLAAAIAGAAASMGFSVRSEPLQAEKRSEETSVETRVENSEVLADATSPGQTIVVQKDNLKITFGQDARGACTVCVSGKGYSEKQLRAIGEEAAGRVVQQFAYHKLLTELKKRDFAVVDEQVLRDQSVQLRVRL